MPACSQLNEAHCNDRLAIASGILVIASADTKATLKMSGTACMWKIRPRGGLDDQFWASWDALNCSINGAHPLLSAQFAEACVRHFGGGSVSAAVLENDGRTVGLALLVPAAKGRWQIFCPSQAPVGLLLLDRAGDSRVVHLRGLVRSISVIALALDCPMQDEPFSPAFHPAKGVIDCDESGTTIAASLAGGFDDYWASRPKDLRANIRRYLDRAKRDGVEPRLVVVEDSGTIGAAVDRYGLLESSGWKGAAGTALHPDNVQGAFYKEVLSLFSQSGAGRVYELYLADKLAASRMLVVGGGLTVMLKTTYDENLKQYAVGRLLLYLALQDIGRRGANSRVEFYTRANKDMIQWGTDQRPIVNATVFRNPLVKLAVDQLRTLKTLIKRRGSPRSADEIAANAES